MAGKPNTARNDAQKLAALRQIFEFVYSTKTLLVPETISTRNFQTLVNEKYIESTLKEVLLSPNSKPKQIYLYRLTQKGVNFYREKTGERAEYRPNTYDTRQTVHDLYIQAFIKREGLSLAEGTSSIDLQTAHRRHTKNIRWQRWRYDALAVDDYRFVAVEVERSPKTDEETAVMLSKIRDFVDDGATPGKIHILTIACTQPALAEKWGKAIKKEFPLWHWQGNSKKPVSVLEKNKPLMAQIKHPERVEIRLLDRGMLEAVALPAKDRQPGSTSYGHFPIEQKPELTKELVAGFMALVLARDEERARVFLEKMRATASTNAIERIEGSFKGSVAKDTKKRLLERNRQLKTALEGENNAEQRAASAEQRAAKLQKQLDEMVTAFRDVEIAFHNDTDKVHHEWRAKLAEAIGAGRYFIDEQRLED